MGILEIAQDDQGIIMSETRVELVKSNHRRSVVEIIRRVLWSAAWMLLCRWTPRIFNGWRLLILRAFGAKLGKRVLIFGSVRIDMPWNLEIGDFSAIGRRVWLYNFAPVRIGSNTVVSQDCVLCTSSHDYTHPHLPLYSKEIIVGDEAWIAADSFVMPGLEVGAGSVVGARSVVTKNVPAWTVCAGSPCRAIKPRILVPQAAV